MPWLLTERRAAHQVLPFRAWLLLATLLSHSTLCLFHVVFTVSLLGLSYGTCLQSLGRLLHTEEKPEFDWLYWSTPKTECLCPLHMRNQTFISTPHIHGLLSESLLTKMGLFTWHKTEKNAVCSNRLVCFLWYTHTNQTKTLCFITVRYLYTLTSKWNLNSSWWHTVKHILKLTSCNTIHWTVRTHISLTTHYTTHSTTHIRIIRLNSPINPT